MDEASRHAATLASFVSEPPWRPVPLAPVGRTEEDGLLAGMGCAGARPAVGRRADAVAPAATPVDLGRRGRSRGRVRTRPRRCPQRVCARASLGVRFPGGARPGAVRCAAVVRRRRGGWLRCHVVAPRTAAGMASRRARPVGGRGDRGRGLARAVRSGADIRDARQCLAARCGRPWRRRIPAAARGSGRDASDAGDAHARPADRQRLQRTAAGVCRRRRWRAGDVPVGRCDLDAARSRRAFRRRRRRRPRAGLAAGATCERARSRWPASRSSTNWPTRPPCSRRWARRPR